MATDQYHIRAAVAVWLKLLTSLNEGQAVEYETEAGEESAVRLRVKYTGQKCRSDVR